VPIAAAAPHRQARLAASAVDSLTWLLAQLENSASASWGSRPTAGRRAMQGRGHAAHRQVAPALHGGSTWLETRVTHTSFDMTRAPVADPVQSPQPQGRRRPSSTTIPRGLSLACRLEPVDPLQGLPRRGGAGDPQRGDRPSVAFLPSAQGRSRAGWACTRDKSRWRSASFRPDAAYRRRDADAMQGSAPAQSARRGGRPV